MIFMQLMMSNILFGSLNKNMIIIINMCIKYLFYLKELINIKTKINNLFRIKIYNSITLIWLQNVQMIILAI